MNSISVIMPVGDAEETTALAIESVLKQSFTGIELIIVNTGSTDNTLSIINSFGDKRIRLIDSNPDGVQAINSGIKVSAGKYIALMNPDSIMHIDRLKLQHSMMEEFPEITICSSWEIVFGDKIPKRVFEQKLSGLLDFPLVQLLLDEMTVNSNYTIRKSFIDEHNLMYENSNQAEDYKFWAEAAKLNGGFYIDSQPLIYRRVNDTKISGKYRLEKTKSIDRIKKEILFFLCEKYKDDYPSLMSLYNSYFELSDKNLISEEDIYRQFHFLFMRNKDKMINDKMIK
jgi:glycosyltransferase involved in cell wall biosynthesis